MGRVEGMGSTGDGIEIQNKGIITHQTKRGFGWTGEKGRDSKERECTVNVTLHKSGSDCADV